MKRIIITFDCQYMHFAHTLKFNATIIKIRVLFSG